MTTLSTIKTPYLLYLGDSKFVLEVKTARGIAQWRPDYCIGEIKQATGTNTVGLENMTIDEAIAQGAKTMVLGLANSGGYISPAWIPDIKEALTKGLDIASGLHDKLNANQELVALAKQCGRQLIDVRDTENFNIVGNGKKRTGNRILAVGTDCAVGKMYTALSITQEMKNQGMNASFRATGQTGILIDGSGICVDAVVADFMSGAIEVLTPENSEDHWDVIEGQGSLFNPSFAGISLALLHGGQPDYLVLCHEASRSTIKGLPHCEIPSLSLCLERNLQAAQLTNKNVKLGGIALNTRLLEKEEALKQIAQLEKEFNVPCFDPVLTGAANFVEHLKKIHK